jgi:hypothetical protein
MIANFTSKTIPKYGEIPEYCREMDEPLIEISYVPFLLLEE